MNRVILTADSPCDIGKELQQKYSVKLFPLHILIDGKDYLDDENLDTDMLYDLWQTKKMLPKTAAGSIAEYIDLFSPFVNDGDSIVHISLGSGLSCSYQNALLASQELKNVYVIDSCSLSTGFGLLVCQAGDRIAQGMGAQQIFEEVSALNMKNSASFVLDTLEFLHAGGRCSSLASLGANLMSIKPQIKVINEKCGSMSVGKKYVGKYDKCVLKYMTQMLEGREDIDLTRVFITHAGMSDDALIEAAKQKVMSLQNFKELHITRASSTISSHCGPNTIGVLFMTK
ncbi:MAG: DegV family protein [Eubacteriales bacterium]|nr:DegV family protein [Eubacteriales bacterium]